MADDVLRVWVLSDGQAGHYNQSRGIVHALQTLRPVETRWIDVRLRAGLVRGPLRWRLNHGPRPAGLGLLKVFCRIDALPESRCDVLVSAGGKTSFANAWLAALLRVPNVYAGSLRDLRPDLFSAVLTLEPVPGATRNLVLPLPPSAIDANTVAAAGAAFRDRLGIPEQRYWTLLLGGNGAGYRYRSGDWRALGQLAQRLAEHYGIRWLIASSRRTGAQAERLLRKALGDCVASACWYRAGDAFPVDEYLGAAERVFVTEDSMTMLTEAIYAQRPVVSLAPRQASPGHRFRQALQRYADQGWVCRHAIDALVPAPERIGQQGYRQLDTAPAQALGQRLARLIFHPD